MSTWKYSDLLTLKDDEHCDGCVYFEWYNEHYMKTHPHVKRRYFCRYIEETSQKYRFATKTNKSELTLRNNDEYNCPFDEKEDL